MTGITSAGAASGMDFESIISASVEAKRASLARNTTTRKEESNIELSGVGKLKSALEEFQKSLESFTDGKAFNARKVTTSQSADNQFFTVSANDDATNMYHDIAVKQLATTEKISKTFNKPTNGEDTLKFSAGTMTIKIGDGEDAKEFSIEVEEGATIETIRKQINDNDLGVTANIVKTKDGIKFTLDSGKSGDTTANDISISVEPKEGTTSAEGTISLREFSYDGNDSVNRGDWNLQEGTNAQIYVDGELVENDTNVFEDQISGITITANRVSEKKDGATGDSANDYVTHSLELTEDTDAVTKSVESFVNAYNTLMSTMTDLYEHNTYTDGQNNYDGGELAGDSTVRSLKQTLTNMITTFGSSSTSSGKSIFNMGIEFEKDGTLSLDKEEFTEALKDNYNAVVNAFSGDNSIITQLDDTIEEYTKSGGLLSQREDQINQEIKDIEQKEASNEDFLEKYEESLRQKYAHLDSVMSGYNSSLSYLQSIM